MSSMLSHRGWLLGNTAGRALAALLNFQLFPGGAHICACCSVALVEAPRWIRVSSSQGPELAGGAQGGLGPLLSWNCLYCAVIVYNVLDFLTPCYLFDSIKRINVLLWASCCLAASFCTSQLDALQWAVTCVLAQAPADRQARAACSGCIAGVLWHSKWQVGLE